MRSDLSVLIAETIKNSGPIDFEKFMDLALYHPRHGFYTCGQVRIGGDQPDFTTSAHISKLFGATLARLVVKADRALGSPDPFHLIEGGPGEGKLALDMLDTIKSDHPDLYSRLVYVPDEISEVLSTRRDELLADHAQVVYRKNGQERGQQSGQESGPLPSRPVEGLYLSNELVDAFPVHIVEVDEGKLSELFIASEGDKLIEELRPLDNDEVRKAIENSGLALAGSWRMEVNLHINQWLHRVGALLSRGFLVTIDYGDPVEKLYGPQRPEGTIRGFRADRFAGGVLELPGETDITASVDFSTLITQGEVEGFGEHTLMNQRNLLFTLGITEEYEKLEAGMGSETEKIQLRQQLWPLIFSGTGMGDTFKALVQAKGATLEALDLKPPLL